MPKLQLEACLNYKRTIIISAAANHCAVQLRHGRHAEGAMQRIVPFGIALRWCLRRGPGGTSIFFFCLLLALEKGLEID